MDKSEAFWNGIDPNSLPIIETENHIIENHQFINSQNVTSELITDSPLRGYSLNSNYKTRIIELKSNASSSMVRTENLIHGFGCLQITNAIISTQLESIYPVDFDQDSAIDVSYQFDSSSGKVWKINSTTELLIDLNLSSNQHFIRPDFAVLDFSEVSKAVIIFVIHNTEPTAQAASNQLYLLFDNALFNTQSNIPLSPIELLDLNTNPELSVSDKGYFLELNQGQLISTAITVFNHQVNFITQSPTTDPITGTIEYTNKLISIDLDVDSNINPIIQSIPNSDDLLELRINISNHLQITIGSQFGTLINFPGECRPLYQYEN